VKGVEKTVRLSRILNLDGRRKTVKEGKRKGIVLGGARRLRIGR